MRTVFFTKEELIREMAAYKVLTQLVDVVRQGRLLEVGETPYARVYNSLVVIDSTIGDNLPQESYDVGKSKTVQYVSTKVRFSNMAEGISRSDSLAIFNKPPPPTDSFGRRYPRLGNQGGES